MFGFRLEYLEVTEDALILRSEFVDLFVRTVDLVLQTVSGLLDSESTPCQ